MSTVSKPLYRIVILSGPEKGTAYQLMATQVKIGRDKDNDIVLSDDSKMSRHHAQLLIAPNAIEVADLSQKNKITVGNQKLDRARLLEGMTFTVGATEMRVERLSDSALGPRPSAQPPAQNFQPPMQPRMPHPPPPPYPRASLSNEAKLPPRPPQRRRRAAKKSSPVVFYIIIGIVVAGGYLFLSDSKAKKSQQAIRSSQDVESTIKESERAQDELRKKADKRGVNFQEAQALYIQGFRDYKKGQYSRALESFRGALSVNPDHQLAQRYLKMARRRLDEAIQFHMIQGRQFRARQMYDKCSAAFTNVLNSATDPNSASFKEAKQLKAECDLYSEGRY